MDLDLQNIAWKLRDCFGKHYTIDQMPGSGFCGFHCLAYCITGDPMKHSSVIKDCMTVFENVPELFQLRTNFASRGESATFASYQQLMSDAQRHVQFGLAIHTDAWCEDGHFAAISLLHDIAIFTYSLQTKQWHVFNESATRGYICLLSTPGHFDVLQGVHGPPAIPRDAHTHGVSRSTFTAPTTVWSCLQQDYSFQNVFYFPATFRSVHLFNYPVQESTCGLHLGLRSDTSAENDVIPGKVHDNTSFSPERSYADVVKGMKTVLKCDFPGCIYTAEKSTSLTMHRLRVHEGKQCV